ncbi:hypothetical protein V3C99_018748 [Haemonchus contortus]
MYDNLVINCEEDEAVEEDHIDPLWSPDESDDDDGPSTSREGTLPFRRCRVIKGEETENRPLDTICNADQNGFEKELHSART